MSAPTGLTRVARPPRQAANPMRTRRRATSRDLRRGRGVPAAADPDRDARGDRRQRDHRRRLLDQRRHLPDARRASRRRTHQPDRVRQGLGSLRLPRRALEPCAPGHRARTAASSRPTWRRACSPRTPPTPISPPPAREHLALQAAPRPGLDARADAERADDGADPARRSATAAPSSRAPGLGLDAALPPLRRVRARPGPARGRAVAR